MPTHYLNRFDRSINYLTVLRVGTACILLLTILALGTSFNRLFGSQVIVDPQLLQLKQSSTLPSMGGIIEALHQQWDLAYVSLQQLITCAYIGLCLLLAIGLLTKLSSFLLLVLHCLLFTAIPTFSYGLDFFCQSALFYCLLFPTQKYGSLDRYLFKQKPDRPKHLDNCQRIIQVYLCLVYFFGGIDKALGASWWNGEALWKAINLPYFKLLRPIDLSMLATYPWLFTLTGWAVVLLEVFYPLLVWKKPLGKPTLYLIIAMHTGIALLLGLHLFSMMMILLNSVAWLCPYPSENTNSQQNSLPLAKPLTKSSPL